MININYGRTEWQDLVKREFSGFTEFFTVVFQLLWKAKFQTYLSNNIFHSILKVWKIISVSTSAIIRKRSNKIKKMALHNSGYLEWTIFFIWLKISIMSPMDLVIRWVVTHKNIIFFCFFISYNYVDDRKRRKISNKKLYEWNNHKSEKIRFEKIICPLDSLLD